MSHSEQALQLLQDALTKSGGNGMEAAALLARALLVTVRALGLRLRLDVVPGESDDDFGKYLN